MKKVLTTLVTFTMIMSPVLATSFQDVGDTHLYNREVQYMQDNNIANGFSDGSYRPDTQITRAELTKMVIASKYSEADILNCTIDTSFPDITEDNKFLGYICMARNNGILSGYSDGTFRTEAKISFGEATKIIMNTLDNNHGITSTDLFQYMGRLEQNSAYPPSVSIGNKDAIVTRGEIAFLIRVIMENYVTLPPMPKSTYEIMLRRGEEKTITETGVTMRMYNHGIHCSTQDMTFIEVNITKDGQTQQLHLQRSCTGFEGDGIISGVSTQEGDAFGYHFKLAKVVERETYIADTFEYYIQFE